MKYFLSLLAVSYALRCLSHAAMNGREVANHLRQQANKIEHDDQEPRVDGVRRFAEGLWFVLYLLMAYKLVRR